MNDRTINLVSGLSLLMILGLVWGCASKSTSTSTGSTMSVKASAEDSSASIGGMKLYDEAPVLIKMPKLHYPEKARLSGIEGIVKVKVLVGADGSALDAIISQESGSQVGFEEEALRVAKKSTWKPATFEGKGVVVWVAYPVVFHLN